MNKKRRKQYKEARKEFEKMRSFLFLNHYTLTFRPNSKPGGKHTAADVSVSATRKVAVIRLGDDFYNASAEERRHYVLHELLHIHLTAMDYAVSDLKYQVTASVWDVFYRNFNRQLELAVDALADILTPISLQMEEKAETANENVIADDKSAVTE